MAATGDRRISSISSSFTVPLGKNRQVWPLNLALAGPSSTMIRMSTAVAGSVWTRQVGLKGILQFWISSLHVYLMTLVHKTRLQEIFFVFACISDDQCSADTKTSNIFFGPGPQDSSFRSS